MVVLIWLRPEPNANYEYYKDNTISRVFSLEALNVKGRYIRIQAVGTTKLSLAEIDVIGRSISTEKDCNGEVGGLAYLDECGNCVGGNTGLSPCALDANYVWGGSAITSTLTSSVLPVDLVHFSGKLINDQTQLNWISASEYKVAGYELQRSKNAIDWEHLSFTRAQNRPNHYRDWDDKPFNNFTYYRLKMIDQDGSFDYSKVVAVQRETVSSILLYPNPTSDKLHVEFESPKNSSTVIAIFDILGRRVYQQKQYFSDDGQSFSTIDLGNLTAGTYYLQYTIEGYKHQTVPFVIARR